MNQANATRPVGQVTVAIRSIEDAVVQLRDQIFYLEEAIAPALKPESPKGCDTGDEDVPERSALTNELDLHLNRLLDLRHRVSEIISRVDI